MTRLGLTIVAAGLGLLAAGAVQGEGIQALVGQEGLVTL